MARTIFGADTINSSVTNYLSTIPITRARSDMMLRTGTGSSFWATITDSINNYTFPDISIRDGETRRDTAFSDSDSLYDYPPASVLTIEYKYTEYIIIAIIIIIALFVMYLTFFK